MALAALLVAAQAVGGQVAPAVRSDAASADEAGPRSGAGVGAEDGLRVLEVEARPGVDGRLDDPVWADAEYATGFVQQKPDVGLPASEVSEVRIVRHGDALYVGARLSDSEPDRIVERLGRRDDEVVADWFYVYLDSYHDRRTAFAFGVSAAGAQRDLRVYEDNREDVGWDAVWASETSREGDGWVVEMEIPLSQLRFNGVGAGDRWGVNFRRDIARRNETAYWAEVRQGTDRFVSLFGELSGLEGLEPTGRVEILPYTVAGLVREPGVGADPFHDSNAAYGTVGADVRVGLGSSLTLSGTLNPDFGQVEADPATVNLTAFETFQQERRPFFTEGADIFTLSFPFWPPFFYSRRIGRAPQGPGAPDAVYEDRPTATTILGALKLSGKTDDGWSVGLLEAVTQEERLRYMDPGGSFGSRTIEPRTSYSAGRVFKELRDGRTGAGAMVAATHRALDGTGMDFLHGEAYGFGGDAFHRFRDGEYIANLAVLGSHVRGSERALLRTQRAAGHYFQRPDADHVELDPSRTSLSGMSVSGRIQRVEGRLKWGLYGEATTPGYEINDLGFNPMLDQQLARLWVRWEDYTPGRIFQSWWLGSMGGVQRGWGGELQELTADLGFYFQLRNYWGGGIWAMRHRPSWTTTALRGGPALRRPGRWMGTVNLNSDRRRDLAGDGFVFWTVEDEGGGYQVNGSANLALRPSDRIDVRVGPSWSRSFDSWQYVGRAEGGDGDPVHLVGGLDRRTVSLSARLNVTFAPALSLQLYARPFLASGSYGSLREASDPTAHRFDARFRTYGAAEAVLVDGAYRVDRDGDGAVDLTVADPSFNVASLQMNTVIRWEYRPGSTLYAVWTHDRSRSGREPWSLRHDLDRLVEAPSRNVFQLKLSYWLGL